MRIACITPEAGGGWAPITTMATLAGEAFGAPVAWLRPRTLPGRARRAVSVLPRRRGRSGTLLAIVATPGDLVWLASADTMLHGYERVAAWVIDSFWTERIPRMMRPSRMVDDLFVTDVEVAGEWAFASGLDVQCLPWGADTLHPALVNPHERDIDVLRLGRQPDAWGDDATNQRRLAPLRYQGRFPVSGDASGNQAGVLTMLGRSKAVLASTNLVDPSDYTHPTREYISARWCDAAAAGTLVAGVAPEVEAARLLPADGLVELDLASGDHGLGTLRDAVDGWTPERSASIRAHAKRHLDWRHRFAALSDQLGVPLTDATRADVERLVSAA